MNGSELSGGMVGEVLDVANRRYTREFFMSLRGKEHVAMENLVQSANGYFRILEESEKKDKSQHADHLDPKPTISLQALPLRPAFSKAEYDAHGSLLKDRGGSSWQNGCRSVNANSIPSVEGKENAENNSGPCESLKPFCRKEINRSSCHLIDGNRNSQVVVHPWKKLVEPFVPEKLESLVRSGLLTLPNLPSRLGVAVAPRMRGLSMSAAVNNEEMEESAKATRVGRPYGHEYPVHTNRSRLWSENSEVFGKGPTIHRHPYVAKEQAHGPSNRAWHGRESAEHWGSIHHEGNSSGSRSIPLGSLPTGGRGTTVNKECQDNRRSRHIPLDDEPTWRKSTATVKKGKGRQIESSKRASPETPNGSDASVVDAVVGTTISNQASSDDNIASDRHYEIEERPASCNDTVKMSSDGDEQKTDQSVASKSEVLSADSVQVVASASGLLLDTKVEEESRVLSKLLTEHRVVAGAAQKDTAQASVESVKEADVEKEEKQWYSQDAETADVKGPFSRDTVRHMLLTGVLPFTSTLSHSPVGPFDTIVSKSQELFGAPLLSPEDGLGSFANLRVLANEYGVGMCKETSFMEELNAFHSDAFNGEVYAAAVEDLCQFGGVDQRVESSPLSDVGGKEAAHSIAVKQLKTKNKKKKSKNVGK